MNYSSFKHLLHRKPKKIHLLILFFVLIVAIASLVSFEAFNVSVTNASSNMLVSGNAWSSNVGWISFSGTVADSSHTPYGVYENSTTGVLSGNAWSYSQPDQANPTKPSGLGWLQFGVSDATHPPAKVNFSNGGKITGFARFTSATLSGSPWGSSTNGWVSFSGTKYKVVQKANCAWSGYAWEPDVAGWIEMSGNTQSGGSYGVQGTNFSVCSQVNQSQLTCTASQSATQVTFTASPGTLSPYTWKLNGALRAGNTSSLTVTTTSGNSYTAQVSASVGGAPQTAYCPLITIPTTSSGTGTGTAITGKLTAYPNRVEEGNPTQIKFTWTLDNVNKTDTCDIKRRATSAPSSSPLHNVTGGGGTLSNTQFPNTRGNASYYNNVSDKINTQTTYHIECNGSTVSGSSVIVNVVPTFSNF